jgi:tRNA-dihydrouridine synthase B
MREPEHAARVIGAMAKAVKIPVTVKMRAGWNDRQRNAPALARMVQDAGAAAVTVHGRTAEQSYKGLADWDLVASIADDLRIPVFGSGDCLEPADVVGRMQSGVGGVLVGRGVLRNPWILAQAAQLARGETPSNVTLETRGRFLLDYIDLLLHERTGEAERYRHLAPTAGADERRPCSFEVARGHDRWVINKLRALCAWYGRGMYGASQLRVRVNAAEHIDDLRDIVRETFMTSAPSAPEAGPRPYSRV